MRPQVERFLQRRIWIEQIEINTSNLLADYVEMGLFIFFLEGVHLSQSLQIWTILIQHVRLAAAPLFLSTFPQFYQVYLHCIHHLIFMTNQVPGNLQIHISTQQEFQLRRPPKVFFPFQDHSIVVFQSNMPVSNKILEQGIMDTSLPTPIAYISMKIKLIEVPKLYLVHVWEI